MFQNFITLARGGGPTAPMQRIIPIPLGEFPMVESSETRSASFTPGPKQKGQKAQTVHYFEGGESAILRRILDPGVNLCVWQRSPHRSAQSAVEALQASAHSLAIHTTSPNLLSISTALRAVVNNPDIRVRIGLDWLAADAIHLAGLFSELSGAKRVRIRFERVEDNGCAAFHEDNLSIRMVCVYTDLGIEWVPEELVHREEIGAAAEREVDKANEVILPDAHSTRTVPGWHVSVFAGKKWRPGLTPALVHRSPAVGTPNDFRLRLLVDDIASAH